MSRAAPLALLALLAACGPVPRATAERQCYDRARLAMQPRGEAWMGVTSGRGASAGLDLTISTDYLQGRDPAQVYDSCVLRRSGALPSQPFYALPPGGPGGGL